MLIHVDSSAAADVTSSSLTAPRSHAAVENLLLAHFEGNHVVSLLPDDAAALRGASPAWSGRARRALEHVEENYPQIAGLRADLPWSLELGLGPAFAGQMAEAPGGVRAIRASLLAFEKLHTTSCAALLGENATDADFFRQLGLIMRAHRRWETIGMIHDAHGTGGSTLGPEFAKLADRGNIVLALADSDMRHPEDAGGGTFHKLETEAKRRPSYQRARSIPARTAEGLVPLEVYRDAFTDLHGSGDQRLSTLDRLRPVLRSAPSSFTQHAHFKDGIRLHQVENPRTEAEGRYWREVARKVGRDRCTRATHEQCTKRDECKCFVVDALGPQALADVVRWMEAKKSRKRLAQSFDLVRNAPLAALADEVLAWGLALSPLYT